MRESLEKSFLGAIFTYFRERVPAEISPVTKEPSLRLLDKYVNFHRDRFAFTITVDGHVAKVGVFRITCEPVIGPYEWKAGTHELTVDLQYPNSLQMLYEFVMGKRWK